MSYRSTQHLFEQCQASFDPNRIAALLQQAPYHVDSLLAMYDLYRHMGEVAYAEVMMEEGGGVYVEVMMEEGGGVYKHISLPLPPLLPPIPLLSPQECLARALYSLEMGWHPSFNIATANCRLDFSVEENRPLFIALFRHIQVSREGE